MANATFFAEAQFTASKVGKTGLADVTVDVVEHNPATSTDNTTFLVAQAATEVLHGLYRLYFTGDEDMLYSCMFVTADATVDAKEVPALAVLLARLGNLDAGVADVPTVAEFEARTLPSADYVVVSDLPSVPSAADNATAAAAAILETPANLLKTDASGRVEVSGTKNTLDALSGADGDTLKTLSDQLTDMPAAVEAALSGYQIIVQSAVSTDGQITVYQGYDYNSADDRAIEFEVATPDFTGATTALKFDGDTYAGSVVNPGLTTQLLRFEFTAVQTAAMTAGYHAYRLEVTRAGRLLLEETGVINVKE